MRKLFKVVEDDITILTEGRDYIRIKNIIYFSNEKSIHVNSLNQILFNGFEGFLIFTYDEAKKELFQKQISNFLEEIKQKQNL